MASSILNCLSLLRIRGTGMKLCNHLGRLHESLYADSYSVVGYIGVGFRWYFFNAQKKHVCLLLRLLSSWLRDLTQWPSVACLSCPMETFISSFWFRKMSVRDHTKVTEHHLAKFSQQRTAAQAKLAHEKSSSRAFEVALPNGRDLVVNQISLATNARQFLDVSLQKTAEDFFICVLNHTSAEDMMFRKSTSEQYGVIRTSGSPCHEVIRRVISKGLDHGRILPELGGNYSIVVDGSSHTRSDDGTSSFVRGSSSWGSTARWLINSLD